MSASTADYHAKPHERHPDFRTPCAEVSKLLGIWLILPSVCRKTFALRKTAASIFALLCYVQLRQILWLHLWRAKEREKH